MMIVFRVERGVGFSVESIPGPGVRMLECVIGEVWMAQEVDVL